MSFADVLKSAAGKSQRRGGVEVAVDAVRKNNEIWEIHMRLRLDEDNHALESHRGWAFQNLSYLVDAKGETIDNAGLETTMQSENEVGVAYFFDRAEGLDGLTVGLRNAGGDCRVAGGIRVEGSGVAVARSGHRQMSSVRWACRRIGPSHDTVRLVMHSLHRPQEAEDKHGDDGRGGGEPVFGQARDRAERGGEPD